MENSKEETAWYGKLAGYLPTKPKVKQVWNKSYKAVCSEEFQAMMIGVVPMVLFILFTTLIGASSNFPIIRYDLSNIKPGLLVHPSGNVVHGVKHSGLAVKYSVSPLKIIKESYQQEMSPAAATKVTTYDEGDFYVQESEYTVYQPTPAENLTLETTHVWHTTYTNGAFNLVDQLDMDLEPGWKLNLPQNSTDQAKVLQQWVQTESSMVILFFIISCIGFGVAIVYSFMTFSHHKAKLSTISKWLYYASLVPTLAYVIAFSACLSKWSQAGRLLKELEDQFGIKTEIPSQIMALAWCGVGLYSITAAYHLMVSTYRERTLELPTVEADTETKP